VTSLPLRLQGATSAGARVDLLGLPDDEPVLDELADVLSAVGHGNLVDLIRIQPHLALATLEHRSGKPLLQLEGHHGGVQAAAAGGLAMAGLQTLTIALQREGFPSPACPTCHPPSRVLLLSAPISGVAFTRPFRTRPAIKVIKYSVFCMQYHVFCILVYVFSRALRCYAQPLTRFKSMNVLWQMI
jgi:hypothetical protein